MREILRKILSESYDYGEERTPLSFSCEEIVVEMAPDRRLHGSFSFFAEDGAHVYVYSNDLRMELEQEEYKGKRAEVAYSVDSHGLPYGAVHEGRLFLISDHGEYELPYRIRVSGSLPDSSLGEIRNLFHFANLAKANWEEACELFYSERFPHVLAAADADYLTPYRGFSAMAGNPRNVENFLELSRKKTSPVYMPETERVELMLPKKSLRKHIRLVRDGWGYSELTVSAEGEFLSVETDVLRSNDFPGNVAEFSYIIDRSALHGGVNEGAIVVREPLHELRIPVLVNVPVSKPEHAARKRRCMLMRLYLNYRLGRLGLSEFSAQCERVIEKRLAEHTEDLEYRLYQAQLCIAERRFDEAEMILDRVDVLAAGSPVSAAEEGYRLYLKSACTQDADQKRELFERVAKLYEPDAGDWRLSWIFMNMSPAFEGNDRRKWRHLKAQYEDYQNTSPLLFLEAYQIIVQQPKRMDELGDYELALLAWAQKNAVLSREVAERMALLSMDVLYYSEELCRLMSSAYEQGESVVILEALCVQLIRGNQSGPDSFVWYSRAIERELRLSRLYEFYICSASLDYKGLLPRILLMYFAYRSPLDVERNAFLYANVLRHKADYSEVYEQYVPVINEFGREQLLAGRIDDHLAYIYKKLFSGKRQEQEIADAYTEALFMEEICVNSPLLTQLVVVYEHLKEEQIYPLFRQKLILPIYGERVSILLEDAEGNRYSDASLYRRRKFLKDQADPKRLLSSASPSLGALLFLAEAGGELPQLDRDNVGAYALLSESEEITEEYRLRIRLALAEYYFDADEIVPLDELLLRFEPLSMQARDRELCVHIMVARGLYDEAFAWICLCGTEGIDVKILVRLCDRLLARNDQEYDPKILKLCEAILSQGRYDGEILTYLLRYAHGSIKERKELWRAADSFGLDVQELLENTMLQLLFTGEELPEKEALYLEHLSGGVGDELEKAYVSTLCYDFFMRQIPMDDKLFERIAQLHRLGEELKLICLLAWLDHTAACILKRPLTEEEEGQCVEFLSRMRKEGIFLPFFTAFAGLDPYCKALLGQSFIEYRGSEGSQVILHYMTEAEGSEEEPEYSREEMPHVYGGIYVKRFPLFFGERIHYYITEEDGRTEKLTRSSVVEYSDALGSEEEDRFHSLNNVAIAREMKDELTFLKLIRDYEQKKYITEQLFVPLTSRRG